MNKEELKTQLYDEIAKCNRCGFCLAHCPVYAVRGRESATPRGKNALVRGIIEGKIDWTPEIEETLFRCTGCRLCTQTVFPLWRRTRVSLQEGNAWWTEKQYPVVVDRVVEALEKNFNISSEPNENRSMWMEGMSDVPSHRFQKERAEVIYFVDAWQPSTPWLIRSLRILSKFLKRPRLTLRSWEEKSGAADFP